METILCAVDLSPASHETLACAANLARELRTRLEFVHVVRPPVALMTDLPPSLLLKDLTTSAERGLARQVAAIEGPDLQVGSWVGAGPAEEGIVARATEIGASLVVVGAHARAVGHRSFLGSVAERVVHTSPSPVLVIPPGQHALTGWKRTARPLRITGALDESRASDGCLDFLKRLQERISFELHLVHLYWPPREHQRLGLEPPDPFEPDHEAVSVISRELRAHVREHLGNGPASLSVRPWWGADENDLACEAQTDDADLLVVGNTQRRRGSTSIATIRASRIPVLCVPARLALERQPSLSRVRHVLVTTDFSPVANAALSDAYRLVLGGGAVTIVNVNEEGPTKLAPDRKSEIETQLLTLVPPGVNPHTIRTRVFVAEGASPGEAIVQAVHRLSPDLVVMSSHGRTALQRALHGSVTAQVLRHSPKPVLVVPQAASAQE